MGYPIRKSADITPIAASRSLSQLTTSFFGLWRQGIRHVLLVALLSGYGRIETLVDVAALVRNDMPFVCLQKHTLHYLLFGY